MADAKADRSEQFAETIIGTTVYLEMESPEGDGGETQGIVQVSGGSGFFVERDKIVTNFHVVSGCTEITVKHIDTEAVYTIEGIVAYDVENDLAILKIAEEDTPFTVGDSEITRKGDPICAVGYLGDKSRSVMGTVRGIRNNDGWLEIKTQLEPGWSGCPVLNSKGEVIAVHSRGNKSGDIGYTVPSNTLKALLTEVESAKVEPLSLWQKRRDVLMVDVYKLYAGPKWYRLPIVMLRFARQVVKGICYVVRVGIKVSAKDYAGAIKICDKIIASQLIPFLETAYASRGIAKSKLGNYRDAIADANEAILVAPESDSGYFSRGFVNSAQGKSKADRGDIAEAQTLYQTAVNDFTEAINLKPEKAKIYNSRGWTKYLLGQLEAEEGNAGEARERYQEAVADADEALGLASKNPKFRSATYHTRGVAKVGLGDPNGALEDLNEAIRLNPKNALFYQDRGKLKEALGQHAAAKVDFIKATELDPNFKLRRGSETSPAAD